MASRIQAAEQNQLSRGGNALSLRDNADEITQKLSAELTDRVRPAG
jgi:hypothetical protein